MSDNGIIISWSGGKDSVMMLDACVAGGLGVKAFLTTFDESGRVTSHGVPHDLIEAQARELGKPLISCVVPEGSSNEAYEQALRTALEDFGETPGTLAFGDIFLEDVRAYRAGLAENLGFEAFFPLWGQSTEDLAHRIIAAGYRGLVVAADRAKLPAGLCGSPFTLSFLRALPDGTDPCGENGEFHTFIFDGPLFANPVPVKRGQVIEKEDRAQLDIRLV